MGVLADGLYQSSSDTLTLLLVDCQVMEGKEIGRDSYNSMELSEEEVYGSDRGGNEWEQGGREEGI